MDGAILELKQLICERMRGFGVTAGDQLAIDRQLPIFVLFSFVLVCFTAFNYWSLRKILSFAYLMDSIYETMNIK